jgi:hypothetical protein
VPVIACDARRRESSRDVLVALAQHAIARRHDRRAA